VALKILTRWAPPSHRDHWRVNCQLDTGAQANIISIENLKKINIFVNNIKKESQLKWIAVNSDEIPSFGKNIIKCLYKQRCYSTAFLIVDFPCNTILGLTICNNHKVISLINVINNLKNDKNTNNLNEYKVLFEGLGCLPITYNIHIDNNIQPKIDCPRKVPFQLMYDQIRG